MSLQTPSGGFTEGPYRRRTWWRLHLPWFLINLGIAAKGKDCEAISGSHDWYNIDGATSGCYHCKVTRHGQLWKASEASNKTNQTIPGSKQSRRQFLFGDAMLDRSLITFVSAYVLVALHICLPLNTSIHPTAACISFFLGMIALSVLWFRAATAIVRGWREPSARTARFVSLGLLLLTFWPGIWLLIVTFMPVGWD
ncbi:MAG: hypothetical protein FJ184_14645 [Gammaproteobacteria bacterium]|nr:hypothetical protein [Gammaproteobacteria bacterium]